MSPSPLDDTSTVIPPKATGVGSAPRVVPALTIVSHPDPRRIGEQCILDGFAAGREVALSRRAPDFVRPRSALGAPLGDPFLSRQPIHFAPAAEGAVQLIADEGGTVVSTGAGPLHGSVLFSRAQLAAGIPLALADRVVVLLHLVDLDIEGGADDLGMVGQSTGLARVRSAIRRLVDLRVPVLLRGETGTGKELVARALHEHSPRRGQPFISVNLGAIPKELAAAELFGATKGAYTGATRDREGFFRAAHGGTLFLDEVGEAPPEVQVMLLRVLETGEAYPVGGNTPVPVDVRLIAATDANLEEHIRAGRFKAPLLHRLAGYEIHLPPLRERREDIGLLFHHFAREELEAIGEAHRLSAGDPQAEPWLPAGVAMSLVRHAWPGNIRQLRNVTRQLVIGSRGQARLQLDPTIVAELATGTAPAPGVPQAPPLDAEPPEPERRTRRRPSDVTEAELLAAMRESGWELQAAADRLGLPRPSIYDLIGKYRIRTAGDLGADELARCFKECDGDVDRMAERLQVSRRALGRRVRELGLDRGAAR